MKIVLHGTLADLFGKEHQITSQTPAECIEGLSRQLNGWPRGMLVDAVGFDTIELLSTPTKDKVLHLVPSIIGGGGAVGKILIGVAFIALSFIPGIGQIAQMALLSIGISMSLAGVMQLFMKAPRTDKSEDPPPSKYFGNLRNTTEIGTYRINAWGRNRIAGHWLSVQVDAKTLVSGRFPTTPPA